MHTRFTVLGPLRAWRGETELALGPPKRRGLLAFLLTQPGQPIAVHEIINVLWQEDPPDSAVNVVHRHIGALRRILEPELPPRGSSRLLVHDSASYRIEADPSWLDLLRFRQLREQAVTCSEPAEASELLMKALSLWRGPTASGIPAEIRSHLVFTAVDGEHLTAVKSAAELALKAGPGPSTRVLEVLRQSAAQHLLDEALQARLILVLAATGHQAEALDVYGMVRAQLAEDLGVAPGPELQAAHQRVLAQTYLWGDKASARSPMSRTDFPSQTVEVTAEPPAGMTDPERASAGIPVVARPAQLPSDVPCFTGRQTELANFRTLLPRSNASTVVISAIGGMAGVGKTALAVHWAHQIADEFPDGQLYVDLRGFHPTGAVMSSAEAMRSFLEALGVPVHRIPANLHAQAALYRSLLARRRLLIVLDNARDSEHVRPLLPGTGGCLVIVTSRNQLYGLVAGEGAHSVTLDVLDEAEALTLLTDRLGSERIAADPQAATAIVRACAGLPLALAIVSARAVVNSRFPLATIAAELKDCGNGLEAFSGEPPLADARSAFSWSYQLLSAEAARLFRLFALLPGNDCTLAAAGSLAGRHPAHVRPSLSELSRAHLINEMMPGRFTCHELLRAYGTELGEMQDSPEERQAARGRTLDHYLHTAYAADRALAPSRERITLDPPAPGTVVSRFTSRTAAADWLDTSRSVLLAVIEQGAQQGYKEHSWQLAATLELYLDRNGHRQEQLHVQNVAVRAALGLGDLLGQAHAHRALGFANGRLERYDDAELHLARALRLFGELHDPAGQGRVHRYIAFLANARSRHHEALQHYARARHLYHLAGLQSGEGSVANEVGWTHILLGAHHEALAECSRALKIHQEIDDPNGAAAAWDSLGYAHHRLGEYAEALRCFDQALSLYRGLRDRYLEADTLTHIGDALHASGEPNEARRSWCEALSILTAIGHPDAAAVSQKLAGAELAGYMRTKDKG